MDNAVVLQGVPYVWQEINGFCNWAATTILLRYAGVEMTMHDLLAVSGVGFAFAYIKYNDTMMAFPGAIYQQVDPVFFVAQLYGLNYTLYISSDVEGIESQVNLLRSRGVNVGLISGQSEALDLMRSTIDSGYPLLISVDPRWLPASDYDFMREQGITGGGHAVVLVGYDDTAGVAYIQDPGVGSFGHQYGYPVDGRGNYSQISYTNLNLAWSERYYISITLTPGLEPIQNPEDEIGPRVRDLLLGVGERYSPGSSSAYLWQFGYSAFNGLATDLSVDGLKTYLSIFDGVDNEVFFKSALLVFIGLGVESQITLQYLSYRIGLERLPAYLPSVDLTEFETAASAALPHFAALSDNTTLIHPGNVSVTAGFVSQTFRSVANLYNSTGNLDDALAAYSDDLATITTHLQAISDSWKEAGDALAVYWPQGSLMANLPLISAIIGVAAGVVVIAVYLVKRIPSQ